MSNNDLRWGGVVRREYYMKLDSYFLWRWLDVSREKTNKQM